MASTNVLQRDTDASDSQLQVARNTSLEKHLDNEANAVEAKLTGPGSFADPEKAVASTSQPFEDVPEGGLLDGLQCLELFWCSYAVSGTSSFGVYQDFYTQVYITNESSSAISWIGSINAFMTIMGGLFAGKLFDRGYFYHLVIGGAILESFCLFMLSLAKPDQYYQVFLSQGLGVGIASGMMYVPSVGVVSHYFRRRRALAMTLVASGSSLGSVVHPIMLNNLLNKIGFAKAARANAGLVSVLLLCACLLMRTRLPPNPAPIGLREAFIKFSKDKAYVLATVGFVIFSSGYYYPLFYIQLDAALHGLNSTFVFYVLVILNAAAFVGRITPGLVVHRLGVPNMLTFGMGACSILIFGMIGLGTEGSSSAKEASFTVIAVLYGFCAGTYISLATPLLASFAKNQSEMGARIGVGFAFSGIGALIGGPIDGALVTSKFVWWRPALFSGIVTLAGTSCLIAMMLVLKRRPS
ncbi:MFS general substrate transporter [Rhodocollybia butyracea]|uniref:MFS general substrate transporter n=1 Tax=Rhodocollybia butyracea TaxID=206335 RepID=A0A9P5PN55_9AGAR|nr:MFS general substrate transporter [Rhodocollybia butyracea]